jgi:benzoylformate decarboxylase
MRHRGQLEPSAAPDKPVVALVGDGSMYYADSALWTAVHHRIPVLYVIANNGAYGIVANQFDRAGGTIKETGEYDGVVLDNIDTVLIV